MYTVDLQSAISLAILLAAVLVLGSGIIFYLKSQKKVPRRRSYSGPIETARQKHKRSTPFNPLRGVSFRELLDNNSIAEKISANAADWIEESLGEGGMKAIQAAAVKTLAKNPSSASTVGLSLAPAKTSANQTLQILADGQQSKIPGKLGDALSAKRLFETSISLVPGMIIAASPVVPVVVGCFNLISGFEKAIPWRHLDDKLRENLELRALDRLSHLQAVFEEVKGELSTADPDANHLRSLRLKIKEIRLTAQNEIRLKLSRMKPPLPKVMLWWRWGLRKRQAEMRDQILTELSRLREVQVAIHLEQLIWMTLGQSPVFIDEIAPDIVADLKMIGELTKERISWVKGPHGKSLSELKSIPSLMAEVLEFENEECDLRPKRSRKIAT
jgi:hypothetical protein